MSKLQSKRLDLIPLSYQQMLLFRSGRHELERFMGFSPSHFEYNSPYDFEDMLVTALDDFMILHMHQHPEHSLWYTHWIMLHREQNLVMGGMGMSGPPDAEGRVSVGYFVDQKSERQGFATEALQALTAWIFEHPAAETIVADTLVDAPASQKVLEKSGFVLEGPCEDGLRWIRKRD